MSSPARGPPTACVRAARISSLSAGTILLMAGLKCLHTASHRRLGGCPSSSSKLGMALPRRERRTGTASRDMR
eukprot:scaffold6_cov245-Pinguiococcus_pyrenoidosus.AAC.12